MEACRLTARGLLLMGWQGNVATTTFSAGAFDLTRRKVVQYVSQPVVGRQPVLYPRFKT